MKAVLVLHFADGSNEFFPYLNLELCQLDASFYEQQKTARHLQSVQIFIPAPV